MLACPRRFMVRATEAGRWPASSDHNDLEKQTQAEHRAAGTVDGYVFEEIAENLAALGKREEARPYFGKAVDELSQDEWFAKNEAARLANLKSRASYQSSQRPE